MIMLPDKRLLKKKEKKAFPTSSNIVKRLIKPLYIVTI